ncbi:MAG: hypothetical protein MK102_11495 [Fuerstiella sp.]|nr:hypothetical protein [Fuerstiella sp.]
MSEAILAPQIHATWYRKSQNRVNVVITCYFHTLYTTIAMIDYMVRQFLPKLIHPSSIRRFTLTFRTATHDVSLSGSLYRCSCSRHGSRLFYIPG